MGDQQQKIEALRAAMTSIQERDPDEPVPDFLVVDTSVPAAPAEADSKGIDSRGTDSTGTDATGAVSMDAGPAGAALAESVPGGAVDAESDSVGPDLDGPELTDSELADLDSGSLERELSAEARPLVDPGELRTSTGPFAEQNDGESEPADRPDVEDPAAADYEAEDPEPEAGDGEDEPPSGDTAQLGPEEQYEKARAVVLRRLTGSPKSRHQLAVALKEKEFSPEIITRVLDRMEEVHLVNDTEFARTWVRGRHELKNLGRSALRRELREKGISEPVAEDALEQISAEDEGAAARELVRRKLQGKTVPTGPSPEERAERDKLTRRLVSMLARRGHAPGAAFQIVREVIEDHSNA